MATVYPARIDTSSSLPTITNSTPFSPVTINILRDTIIAIETQLGTLPAGIYGTVKNRLDSIDSAINSLISGGGGIIIGGDLGGTSAHALVIGLHGTPVASTAPTDGYALIFNGSAWVPGNNFGNQALISSGGFVGPSFAIATANATISSNKAVFLINGKIQQHTGLASVPMFGFLATGLSSGNSGPVIISGLLSGFSLGDGYACAVGVNSSGTPVRVTDPTCLSATNYLGYCDGHGTICVAPEIDTIINVQKFGMDPTGVADCTGIFANILTFVANNIQFNHIHFPSGRYRFNSGITIPGGIALKITGDGISNQLNPNVYKGGSQLLAYGGGTFLSWGTNGHNESGGIELSNLEILGQLDTGFAADPTTFNQIGVELLGVVGATISRCRFGSFQYQISIDGAEGTNISDIQFDGGGDGHGYQDAATNLDGCNQLVISSASGNGVTPIALTFASAHLLASGASITIASATGNTAMNGTFVFTKTGANTGTIAATGNGTYNASTGIATSPIYSAFAIRIGSFNFSVGNSANEAYITNCNFNNTRWGTLHQDGVTHAIDKCTYELAGGMAVIGSPEGMVFTRCSGENAHVANIWVTDWLRAQRTQVFALGIGLGNFFGIGSGLPIILIDPLFGEIIGCDIRGSVLFTSGVPAISGAGNILGNVSQGGNYLVGPLVDTQTSATSVGLTVNDLKEATSVIDAYITAYGNPLWRFRAANFIFSEGPNPSAGAGTQFDQFEQLLHSANAPSTRYGRGLLYKDVALGAGPTSYKVLSPVDAGSGAFIIEVTAHHQGDASQVVYWKIRQLFNVVSGTVNLLSLAATLDSDVSIDGAFVQPTITGSGGDLQITITGHPAQITSWAVRGYIVEGISS